MIILSRGEHLKKNSMFTPVFPNRTLLKLEVRIIFEEYSDKKVFDQIEEVTSGLNEFNCKPNKENLKRMVEH